MARTSSGTEAGTIARVLHIRRLGGGERGAPAGGAGAGPGRGLRGAGARLRHQPAGAASACATAGASLDTRLVHPCWPRSARPSSYRYYNAQFATGTESLHEQCDRGPVFVRPP